MLERKTVSQCITADYCRGWNDAVAEMSKWICVEDTLPDICKKILVAIPHSRYGYTLHIGERWHDCWWVDAGNKFGINNISRWLWMPLPEAPKE